MRAVVSGGAKLGRGRRRWKARRRGGWTGGGATKVRLEVETSS